MTCLVWRLLKLLLLCSLSSNGFDLLYHFGGLHGSECFLFCCGTNHGWCLGDVSGKTMRVRNRG